MTSKRTNVTTHKKENYWCSACLCRNRNLYSLGKYRQIFETLCGYTDSDEHEVMDSFDTFLCWECITLLRRVRNFQKMVQKSKNMLSRSISENSLPSICFSNLKISEMITLDTFETEKENETEKESCFDNDDFGEESQTKPEIQSCYDNNNIIGDEYEEESTNLSLKAIEPIIEKYNTVNQKESNETTEDKPINLENLCPIQEETLIFDKKCEESKIKKGEKPKIRKYPNERSRQYLITYQSLKWEEAVQKIPINILELAKWLECERNSAHYKSLKNKCNICLQKLKLKENIKRHIKDCHTASEQHPFGCDICSTYFPNKYRLQRHIKQHFYIRLCTLCGYECYSQLHMRYHLRKSHQKNVACLQCEARFKNTRDFYVHLKSHEIKYYFCDQCGKRARSLPVLEKHIKRHHMVQRCGKCDTTFKSYKILAKHDKEVHTARGPSELSFCAPCNKQFNTVRAYRTHFLNTAAHQAERDGKPKQNKVPCPICLKIFSRKATMMNHYRWVHTHDSKYKCEQCGKSFLNRTKYKDHMQFVHMGVEKPKNKICKYCDRGFATNQILSQHILTHTGARPHACPHCARRHRQLAALNTHIQRTHRNKDSNKHDEVYIVVPYDDHEAA